MAVQLSVQEEGCRHAGSEAVTYDAPAEWSREYVLTRLMNLGFARATPAQALGLPTVLVATSGWSETLYLPGADMKDTAMAVKIAVRYSA